MNIDSTQKKLWEAIIVLATGTKSLQDRLAQAATSLVPLRDNAPRWPEMPALVPRLEAVIQQLTSTGSIDATGAALNNADASRIALEILELYAEASSRRESERAGS